MTHIFISYSKRDSSELAIELYEKLNSFEGITAWIDRALTVGQSWESQIQAELDRADVLVILLSPDINRSSFVMNEIMYFSSQQKPIIPIMVQRTQIPIVIAGMQYIDFSSSDRNLNNLAQKIVEIIEKSAYRLSSKEVREQRKSLEESIKEASTSIEKIIEETKPKAEQLLVEAVKHHKNKVYNRAVEAYIQVLKDRENPIFRLQAVQGLTDLKSAETELVENLLQDPDDEVRLQITKSLRHFQTPLVMEKLEVVSVADSSLAVRVYAQMVFRFFREPNTVQHWLDRLQRSNDSQLMAIASDAYLLYNEMSQSSGHVFISYSRRDGESFTLQLVDILRQTHKYKIWMDTNLTPGSESWKRGIAKAIEQCSLLLLILSPEVHNSHYISEEVSYAEQLSKQRLFVKYKQTHMPFGMTDMQGLRDNLTFEDYPDEMIAGLVEEFERRNIPKTV